ncbi:MAG: DNA recombination protein RmuC [Microbacterium sp.]|uniref:DNA recombination protein RmuC n=1 Tax=Microbacterium sp. TaxID=51671 RepID=UPI000DB6E7BF|nr:DNA recombination protein RmuC [Microbacterium sp.]PZU41478.1 MAG: DNA recombination protein RmuC [Microbacterium sp.]
MEPLTLVVALAALVLGALLGWLARGGRAQTELATLRARAGGAESLVAGLREQLAHQRAADADRAERERRDQAVLQALSPVRETLQSVQRQITDLERERGAQYGAISAQLRLSLETDEQLRRTTESLAGALRSNGTRGVWGETALRRVVESAGLTRHVDFTLQTHIATDQGAGRPDMIIRLPGDAAIPVDAKVPLDAYLEATAIPVTASGDEAERRTALLQRHVRAVRVHIDALAKKAYWTGIEGAPEFVICFIPNESLLATALDEDPALLDYAFTRRVALASPVNLWAVLKTVAFAWTQQDVSVEARRLFDLGSTLYQRLGSLAGHAEALRRSIERTVESYNRFAGSLESRVLVTARQFPGIDETQLLPEAVPLTERTRPLTSSEFVASADVGDLRDRIAADD